MNPFKWLYARLTVKRLMVVMALVGLLILIGIMSGCARLVAPVGNLEPDPAKPGAYVMNPALPQPNPADYNTDTAIDTAIGLGSLLPPPAGEAVGLLGLGVAWWRERKRQQTQRALQQTVNGIELAKADLGAEKRAVLTDHLAKTQDEDAKRLVWEARP